MPHNKKNINEFDVYDKVLNDALTLLNHNKLTECKILLTKLKLFSKQQSITKDLENCMSDED